MTTIIIEALMLKGAIAIGHWMTHGGAVAIGKTLLPSVSQSIANIGFAKTLAGLAGMLGKTFLVSSLIVGGVLWTSETVELLADALEGLSQKDYLRFVRKCAKLSSRLHIEVKFLPEAVYSYLIKAGFSIQDAKTISEVIASSENEIIKYI